MQIHQQPCLTILYPLTIAGLQCTTVTSSPFACGFHHPLLQTYKDCLYNAVLPRAGRKEMKCFVALAGTKSKARSCESKSSSRFRHVLAVRLWKDCVYHKHLQSPVDSTSVTQHLNALLFQHLEQLCLNECFSTRHMLVGSCPRQHLQEKHLPPTPLATQQELSCMDPCPALT